jgi:soluble lytic murein transglycosylase-like protein
MLTRFLIAATLTLGMSAPTSAQIYSWRDASGTLVLSNRRPPKGVELQSYAVPRADGVRTTRFATLERSQQFDDLIVQHARLNGVRTDLVRAVMQVESAFNPRARSPKGALGLMQLMPATIEQYRVKNPFDPADNVRGGVAYLRDLLERYENDETLALAAYNAGPAAVDRHGQAVPPYAETRCYVAHVNQMAGRPIQRRDGRIYTSTEVIDGRVVRRYSDRKPTTGSYEIVSR